MASLLASRICHDLVSPLGAIANGLELLAMSGIAAGPELALISESVAAANDRIRFFRIAFGQAHTDQRIARSDLQAAIDAQGRTSRLAIDWTVAPDGAERGPAKLALLAILCLESAMPRGGKVSVEAGGQWRVSGQSEMIRNDNPLWAQLGAPDLIDTPPPALIQFVLLASEARRLGRDVKAEIGANRITLSF
ncbi:histidine phosphotransferase family protein [Frigidibacter sp. RF13]|uniref:histidine phosphotransferase family protein n=1 Tax=Frigidibacter sp. RF13 TaxID=2997340 RepID=UPI0022706D14|nr:histidine phosphotransferase family protein [Frigidibacter sp. RF13]MCY1125712.1 histidine phosphotransferase family protein [Frigidibacter sp. RF13]